MSQSRPLTQAQSQQEVNQAQAVDPAKKAAEEAAAKVIASVTVRYEAAKASLAKVEANAEDDKSLVAEAGNLKNTYLDLLLAYKTADAHHHKEIHKVRPMLVSSSTHDAIELQTGSSYALLGKIEKFVDNVIKSNKNADVLKAFQSLNELVQFVVEAFQNNSRITNYKSALTDMGKQALEISEDAQSLVETGRRAPGRSSGLESLLFSALLGGGMSGPSSGLGALLGGPSSGRGGLSVSVLPSSLFGGPRSQGNPLASLSMGDDETPSPRSPNANGPRG